MEEVLTTALKTLSETPSLALWALAIIYLYKVVIVGSMYGVIRFVVDRIYCAYTTPKHTLRVEDVEGRLRSLSIPNCHEDLIAQIQRLPDVIKSVNQASSTSGDSFEKSASIAGGGGAGSGTWGAGGVGYGSLQYIHRRHVRWLQEAIDDKIAKESASKKNA